MATNEEGIPTELNPAQEASPQSAELINSPETRKNPFDFQLTTNSLITILVCTGLSVVFMRTGLLSFFFLAPIGYAVLVTGSVLFPFLFAALTNLVIVLFTQTPEAVNTAASLTGSGSNMVMEIIYFSSMFLLFTWIMGAKNPRTAYRLLAGSAAGAVIFILYIYKTDFFSLIEEINLLAASEGDESINTVFNGLLPAENITEIFSKILFRGAAFVSMLFIFFLNRYISYVLLRLIQKRRGDKPLTEFFAPQNAVWILASAFASVLLAGFLRIELLEIIAWNVFVMSAFIFLAQGAGVLTHLLSKRSAGLRLGVSIIFIFVLLSPLSLAAIFVLLILGIIENWIPIRKGRGQNASYSEAN